MLRKFDTAIKTIANQYLAKLEKLLNSDVIFYYGAIEPGVVKIFRDLIENVSSDEIVHKKLTIIINTPGGSVETVEKLVEITRHHYDEVDFIIPDYAMSAGTIFCMSGNKIWMDYSSSLGPIDPQVFNGSTWVPALGYLDKVEELNKKSDKGKLNHLELLLLKELDFATLSSYEQARELTVSLLKNWLVQYKFKHWDYHGPNSNLSGNKVTNEEKLARAEKIAKTLGDNNFWHTHGRYIGINTLQKKIKLKIENFSNHAMMRNLIRDYNDFILECITQLNYSFFLHSRNYFE